MTSYLRLATAERPDDLAFHRLVSELATDSDDFARLWRDHTVRDCLHTVRRYRHPLVGELELNEEILRLPDDPGQRLIVSAAKAGTRSADRLALLGARTADRRPARTPVADTSQIPAHQRRVISAYRRALDALAGLTRIVGLSGWAANYAGARGPVWGLRPLEEALDTLTGVEVTHLRPGWFMENALPMIEEVRATGTTHGLISGDLPLPAIATADIGAVAADLLAGRRKAGAGTLELQGPREITLNEITAAIGEAVGRPGARYERIDAATMREGLLAAGFSPHMADGTTAMTIDVAERRIAMTQPRDAETATPTTFEEFLASLIN